MFKSKLLSVALLLLTGLGYPFAASGDALNDGEQITLSSPSEKLELTVKMGRQGIPYYTVHYNDSLVIDSSRVASFSFTNQRPMLDNWSVIDTQKRSYDNTWQTVWGEQREIRNHYNEVTLKLKEDEAPNRRLNLIYRVYDDGLGFRYEFPEQEAMKTAYIAEEHTRFNLTGDHTTWWIPGDWDSYEFLYTESKFSDINAIAKREGEPAGRPSIPNNAVNTPVTMRTEDGLHLSFHEAALTNYSAMTLKPDLTNLSMSSILVGSDGRDYKVKRELPFHTPWRTIQIAEEAGGLIESRLIMNLNEPNKLGDISWFKPMKYIGIWWEMHLGKSSWAYESDNHGANTEHTKEMIDFAAKNNIGGVLVEGWNTGWQDWSSFDFVTPYPDYDIREVTSYADEQGVEMIMHHETGGNFEMYESQLDTAYALMESLGFHSVKTGYVGSLNPDDEYHHGQRMVNHYRKVLKKAAESKVAVNAHEPIKATGIRRTYPNAIAREGLQGQEFNAWSEGNPPRHLPTVAFTRMLAGPIDYTPGIFNIKLEPYRKNYQVHSTLAKQLALYVTLYSPLQMAADLPEHYEKYDDAFQFIRDVAVDWEQSEVLNGEVGDYVTIARQQRGTDNWFLGSITNKKARTFDVELDFLDEGKTYKATIYADGQNAHWNENPESYKITEKEVNAGDTLTLDLAPGGGCAVSFMPVD